MSEVKHTPGPWQINGSHIYSADPEREIIAQAQAPNLIANAHLIAAAPEMLEALKQVADLLRDHVVEQTARAGRVWSGERSNPMALNAAYAVIAKASGGGQ